MFAVIHRKQQSARELHSEVNNCLQKLSGSPADERVLQDRLQGQPWLLTLRCHTSLRGRVIGAVF